MRPTSGSARIFGTDVHADGPAARRSVSYQPSADALYESTRVAAYLRAFARMGGVPVHRTDELIERLDLDTSRRIKALSTGNRQKVAIVRALQADVPLYLLDEPTRGLDPLVQQEFGRILAEYRDEGRTIFLSTHILSEAEHLCDRVGLLREGRLVAVERVDVLTESRVRRFPRPLRGTDAHRPRSPGRHGGVTQRRGDQLRSHRIRGRGDQDDGALRSDRPHR